MGNENFSEKVSVNINSSTLSSIDLLVDNGYYSNRSDFINHALRSTLQQNQNILDRVIERNSSSEDLSRSWFAGVYVMQAGEVDALYAKGKEIRMEGYGVLVIGDGVDEEKLFACVKSIQIRGKVICSKTICEHYGLKAK